MPSFAYMPKTGNVPAVVAVINTNTYVAGSDIQLGANVVNASSVCVDSPTNTTKAYVVSQDLITGNQVSVINALTNTVVANISTPSGFGNSLAITPDKTRLYVTSDGGGAAVYVLNTTSNTQVASIATGSGDPQGIAITPDGLKAYVCCRGGGTIKIIDTNPVSGTYNTIIGSIVCLGAKGIAITPDGLLAFVTKDSLDTVSVVDTNSDTILGGAISVGDSPKGISITPDGLLAFVTNQGDDSISVIDTTTKTVVGTTSVGVQPELISITPDGMRVFALNSSDNGIYVISASSPYTVLNNFNDGGTGGHTGLGMFIGTIPDLTIEIIQGTITTLTSPTSGIITDVDGTIFPFNDSTLADRGISLSIGSIIIGAYSGAYDITTNIVPLQPVFDTVNATLTADSFTAAKVKCQLQIAQCCAVKKINKYITNQDDGKRNEKLFNDAEEMFGMIDSLSKQGLFIPEGDLLIGRQATYEIVATSSFGVKDVTLSIGDATYSFSSFTGTSADFAADIAFNINLLYPQSYPYYAISSGINVVISGIAFDEDNNTAITGSTTNGTLTLSPPGYLFGGIAPTYQGKNCLTNQEAQIILSKLKSLCGC